ncbi:MAG: aminoacyl-tRNA hydrolase [Deltaproteobacteria bacterium]|nr:aminoacyl-tRNA hydrolase [Deltaproteobacteria bacterium]MBW2116574.1 aminoacyl-tRNA hydrolase [Deltaproteobacteria bacterium]MBW2344775.1 aminoacyl-tRNA hydrolase [Deltaproteobacteria bacterium]
MIVLKGYLIVGLGNPGQKYKDTRHNTGFQVIDLWSRSLGVHLTNRRFQSRNTLTRIQDKKVILFCPLTFMNRSGQSVRTCVDYYDLTDTEIIVIHDDIDLPVGRIRVVGNGGAGGHKGVLSIIKHLGSMQFPRIKVGIGRPRSGESIEDYVLAPFYSDEKKIMERVIRMAVKACELVVAEGVEPAMNKINCQNLANKEVRN